MNHKMAIRRLMVASRAILDAANGLASGAARARRAAADLARRPGSPTGRAMQAACRLEPRLQGQALSSKGVI
jgi:hypothetical protein